MKKLISMIVLAVCMAFMGSITTTKAQSRDAIVYRSNHVIFVTGTFKEFDGKYAIIEANDSTFKVLVAHSERKFIKQVLRRKLAPVIRVDAMAQISFTNEGDDKVEFGELTMIYSWSHTTQTYRYAYDAQRVFTSEEVQVDSIKFTVETNGVGYKFYWQSAPIVGRTIQFKTVYLNKDLDTVFSSFCTGGSVINSHSIHDSIAQGVHQGGVYGPSDSPYESEPFIAIVTVSYLEPCEDSFLEQNWHIVGSENRYFYFSPGYLE
jgi:hypothetical protein